VTHLLTFCFPETEDTAVIDPTDTILKLPYPVVSGSNRRNVTKIFAMNLSVTMLTKADVSEVECKCFCHLR